MILQHRDGEVFEPFEVLHIEVPETFSGSIIEELSRRKGELKELATNEQLVERAVTILDAMNCKILGPDEVREKLQLN